MDWRYFMKTSEVNRLKLWDYHRRNGRTLADWDWGWRLAWVRVCTYSRQPPCSGILHQALFDQAMVVRAEAATRVGQRYAQSGNRAAIGALAQAFQNPSNWRHGKVLFVQKRILYSLKEIGGQKALATASKLAAKDPEAGTYWNRLTLAKR